VVVLAIHGFDVSEFDAGAKFAEFVEATAAGCILALVGFGVAARVVSRGS